MILLKFGGFQMPKIKEEELPKEDEELEDEALEEDEEYDGGDGSDEDF
jgi:hypothetical protein